MIGYGVGHPSPHWPTFNMPPMQNIARLVVAMHKKHVHLKFIKIWLLTQRCFFMATHVHPSLGWTHVCNGAPQVIPVWDDFFVRNGEKTHWTIKLYCFATNIGHDWLWCGSSQAGMTHVNPHSTCPPCKILCSPLVQCTTNMCIWSW